MNTKKLIIALLYILLSSSIISGQTALPELQHRIQIDFDKYFQQSDAAIGIQEDLKNQYQNYNLEIPSSLKVHSIERILKEQAGYYRFDGKVKINISIDNHLVIPIEKEQYYDFRARYKVIKGNYIIDHLIICIDGNCDKTDLAFLVFILLPLPNIIPITLGRALF